MVGPSFNKFNRKITSKHNLNHLPLSPVACRPLTTYPKIKNVLVLFVHAAQQRINYSSTSTYYIIIRKYAIRCDAINARANSPLNTNRKAENCTLAHTHTHCSDGADNLLFSVAFIGDCCFLYFYSLSLIFCLLHTHTHTQLGGAAFDPFYSAPKTTAAVRKRRRVQRSIMLRECLFWFWYFKMNYEVEVCLQKTKNVSFSVGPIGNR